jgi:hypothetical protein
MITATASHISMTSIESAKFDPKQFAMIFGRAALVALCIMMMVGALHPDLRSAIRGSLSNENYRNVVSTVQGHLAGDERVYTVAKVKTAETLSLEIFEHLGNGQEKLVEKIQLPDSRDGFFDFNGRASNLAMSDVNGDGRPEILAPTFDTNLVGHLNVYNFDPESHAFQKVTR